MQLVFNDYSFIAIKFLGLVASIAMWSISILGLCSNFSFQSLLIAMFASGLIASIFLMTIKEKNIIRINLVTASLVVIGLIQISALCIAFYFPPFVWDEVAYAAALPKLYALKGHFFYAENYGPYSAFPQNFEAISTASLLMFNNLALPKLLNFIFAVGVIVIAGDLALLIGLPKIFAILGGSVIGLSSAFLIFIPTVKNDIANGFFQSAAILMLILYSKKRSLQNTILMGIFLGTSIGIKYNSLLFSICPILVFLWIELHSEDSFVIKVKRLLAFVFAILTTALPWYLNNYDLFSNPVYPIANEIFGAKNDFHRGYSELFRESFYGDANFSWANGSVYAYFIRLSTEFTPVVLLLGLTGALKSLFASKNKQEFYLAIATFGCMALNIRFGFWEPRYSFVLLILLAVQFATLIYFLYQSLSSRQQISRIVIAIILICIVGFTVLGYIRGRKIYGERVQFFKTQPLHSFLDKYVAGYRVADWLNKNTPKDAIIAVWGSQMFYYLDRQYFHIHPLTESGDLISIQNQNDFYKFLVNKNIGYLCLADWRFDSIPDRVPGLKNFFLRLNSWVQELEAQGKITQVETVDGSRIYEISKKR